MKRCLRKCGKGSYFFVNNGAKGCDALGAVGVPSSLQVLTISEGEFAISSRIPVIYRSPGRHAVYHLFRSPFVRRIAGNVQRHMQPVLKENGGKNEDEALFTRLCTGKAITRRQMNSLDQIQVTGRFQHIILAIRNNGPVIKRNFDAQLQTPSHELCRMTNRTHSHNQPSLQPSKSPGASLILPRITIAFIRPSAIQSPFSNNLITLPGYTFVRIP
jgi:hypothetical protein